MTVPSGPSNTYSLSIRTMGSRRRSALSASRLRVCSFSVASSRFLASSHVLAGYDLGKRHANLLARRRAAFARLMP